MKDEMWKANLVKAALSAREKAYAPYSGFRVGAALLGADGRIYTGCNVENASYPVSFCAEQTALCSAVAAGCRRFAAVAVVGGEKTEEETLSSFCPPCGMCRQALSEFCDPNEFVVILAKNERELCCYTLDEIFSHRFDGADLR